MPCLWPSPVFALAPGHWPPRAQLGVHLSVRSSSKPAPDPSNDQTRQQQHQRRQNGEAQHYCEVGGKIIKPLLSFLVGVAPRLFGGHFLVRQGEANLFATFDLLRRPRMESELQL